jgi:Na+/melibiose symporter-like transporter
MVFGLAYESIPRFSSKPLYSRKLGMWQFWLANIGLIGLSLSYPFMRMYMLKGKDASDAFLAVIIFGLIEVISCFIFIYNIWKSMDNQGSSR